MKEMLNKKKIMTLLLGVMVFIVTILLSACGGQGTPSPQNELLENGETSEQTAQESIKIGAIMPVSGAISAFGTQARDGIRLAVDEINEKGGVLGRQIELIVEDDEANPERTANAFQKLATQDKIVGLVGALTSNCSLAITEEAQRRNIPMISPTSTNDTVTDAGDFIFRSCYNDSFQGTVVANFAYEDREARTAAIIFDNSNDYSTGLRDSFIETFEQLGGEVIATESYGRDDVDFRAQLTSINGRNPDVLFIPDYYSKVALIANQAADVGIRATMLGADGWDEIVNNAGDEVVGSFYSNHYSPDSEDRLVRDFVEKYEERFNITPNALAALSYDATYILINAIKNAESVEPEKIRDAMAQTNDEFVTGEISFDENRNPVKSAVMVEVKKDDNGELIAVYSTTVNP